MTYLRRYGFILLVVGSILFPFAFYSSELAARRELSVVEKVLQTVASPVQFAFSLVTVHLKTTLERYVLLRNAQSDSERLRQENGRLAVELQMLREVEVENARLRKLLNFVNQMDVKFVAGQVQSADPSFLYRSIRINRGEPEGIIPGMAVVAADGAVGVVMRVVGGASDVLLITDPNSNLDVIVSRNRRRGILEGSMGSTMQFKYSDRGSRIQVGDEIVTSGLTGSFPRGIVVGRVSRIKAEGDDVAQVIEVEPAVNFSELAEALVLLRGSREVDVIRRVGGGEWMKKIVESMPARSGG